MPNVCILTDSTAQFTQPRFPGHERVHVIPFGIQEAERSGGRPLPGGLSWPNRLASPSVQEFIRFYTRLSRDYDAIVVMTLSSQLDAAMRNALAASEQFGNGVPVEVIDSQATTLGLGLLVQIAAEAASRGASVKEIERLSRASIPRVYMLLCIPELTYLAHSGLMGYAQALVGEMMGILPIFTFEEGSLVPMEKVRTPRHLFEAFQDFLGEFETPVQIALISNAGHGSPRTNPLRQFVQETFPETPFGEHLIQPHLAALFGPRCIGLVVLDSLDQRRR